MLARSVTPNTSIRRARSESPARVCTRAGLRWFVAELPPSRPFRCGAMGRYGPRRSAAQSKTGHSICCRSQIVDRYRRWSHVVWTPSCWRLRNPTRGCRSDRSSVSADFRCRFVRSTFRKSQQLLAVTKKVGLGLGDVKAIAVAAWRKAVDKQLSPIPERRAALGSRHYLSRCAWMPLRMSSIASSGSAQRENFTHLPGSRSL